MDIVYDKKNVSHNALLMWIIDIVTLITKIYMLSILSKFKKDDELFL